MHKIFLQTLVVVFLISQNARSEFVTPNVVDKKTKQPLYVDATQANEEASKTHLSDLAYDILFVARKQIRNQSAFGEPIQYPDSSTMRCQLVASGRESGRYITARYSGWEDTSSTEINAKINEELAGVYVLHNVSSIRPISSACIDSQSEASKPFSTPCYTKFIQKFKPSEVVITLKSKSQQNDHALYFYCNAKLDQIRRKWGTWADYVQQSYPENFSTFLNMEDPKTFERVPSRHPAWHWFYLFNPLEYPTNLMKKLVDSKPYHQFKSFCEEFPMYDTFKQCKDYYRTDAYGNGSYQGIIDFYGAPTQKFSIADFADAIKSDFALVWKNVAAGSGRNE